MANKQPKPPEIVTKLRQVEVLTGQGMPRLDAFRQICVTEQTYYFWKKKYGGMGTDQLNELKRLQKENERPRRQNFIILAAGGIYLLALVLPNLWHLLTKLLQC